MKQIIVVVSCAALLVACESKTRTPKAPPVPDIPMPHHEKDAGPPKKAKADSDAGTAKKDKKDAMKDAQSPIAPNLVRYVPETLAGVKARRRQAVKTAPKAYAYYIGKHHVTYNVELIGPNQTSKQRHEAYPLLGKDKKEDGALGKIQGFKMGTYEGQRTYNEKKKKSEVVLLVNPYVMVILSVQPTKKPDAARDLLKELPLADIAKLR